MVTATTIPSQFVIDPSKDQLIRLNQASKHYPKINGKSKALPTIYRHATKGVRGILLATICDGGNIYTTANAVVAFLKAVEQARTNRSFIPFESKSRTQSDVARNRAISKANQDVDRLLGSQKRKVTA